MDEKSEHTNVDEKTNPDPSKTADWDFSKYVSQLDDPLLGCLIVITKLQNKPFSEHALTAGLPLVDGGLTPELFVRAAQRAGLSAQVVKRPLAKIADFALPAVLLLENKQACVLVDVSHNKAQVIQPETGSGARTVELEKLQETYTGHAIFISSPYHFNLRTEESLRLHPKDWFWGVIAKYWPIYSEVLVASFLINLFALAIPLFIMNVYDRVVPYNSYSTLWLMTLGIFIVIAFDLIMRNLRGYFIDVAGKNIDIQLSATLYEQLLGMRMSVRPKSVGTLANTIQSFESFREFITTASMSVLIDIPFAIIFLIVIWYISGSLVLIPLIAIPIVIAVSVLIQVPLSKKTKELFHYASEKQTALIESLNGAETIKAIGAEGPLQKKWEKLSCHSAKLNIKVRFLASMGINFAMFAQFATTLLVVLWGVYQIGAGALSIGALIAATILAGRAMAPMAQLAALCTRYYQTVTALHALDELMNLETERPRNKRFLHRPTFRGDIEFREVDFHYRGQALNVLDKCSFKIKAGEKVGIVGRVGSGKSTIEKLILGLYSPQSGNILIDGTDIQQIDPADLRRNIGYVPQEVMLFDGTVKENIVYGAPYVDDAAILRVAEISTVADMVNLHPEGYDMPVGEKGEAVSGGQKQTVAVARSLLLDPPILLFDEPTNSMDERTERELIENLLKSYQAQTLVLVTHRSTTLDLVDRIIILDRGKIIADGPRDKILKALAESKIKVR